MKNSCVYSGKRKRKIAIVTATRAEYGLLTPLIRRVAEDEDLELDLCVTGAHLSEKQGYTVDAIREDGFFIAHEIPILEKGNKPFDISLTMANAVKGFAECFRDDRPDIAVILGDRTEMLGVASAAMNERIPIAHIHGGEVTEGAVDDCVRHALTKMSYLHFTATEEYRRRVIQMGEDPCRVFNAGSLGTENILREHLMTDSEVRAEIGIPQEKPYAVVTFHPVTLEDATAEEQAGVLCRIMDERDNMFYLITKANADTGGDAVNEVFEKYAKGHENVRFVSSLGMKRYLSAVKHASLVLGNSSSGILEAPVLGTPTVNIGDRQKGRMMAETVICCEPEARAIREAMEKAEHMPHRASMLFGNGQASEKIVEVIKNYVMRNKIDLKKGFYEVSVK